MKREDDWKLNTAFEKEQRDHKIARFLRVAREDQDMPICLLAERFSMTIAEAGGILKKHKIRRSPDYFSDAVNRKRRMA